MFNGKSARPIANSEIVNFINNKVDASFLYNDTIVPEFINTYFEWIKSSKLNHLKGLDTFNCTDFVHGTSQAFDFWYQQHHSKRFRCLRGDYVYHKVSWKNYFDWCYVEDDKLRSNDALVISLPFSDTGDKHYMIDELLDKCDKLNIPVLIDAAYYCIARDIKFNVDRPCIDTITFSMSKAFYGAERLRIGIRCRKTVIDDGCVLFNQFHCVSKIAAGVGKALCENFNSDYNQIKFRDRQIQICNELNLTPSNCVIFGLTDNTHPEFGNYDRGTNHRRVCISKNLGNLNYE
jgi:hypothetical protein